MDELTLKIPNQTIFKIKQGQKSCTKNIKKTKTLKQTNQKDRHTNVFTQGRTQTDTHSFPYTPIHTNYNTKRQRTNKY